MKRTVCCGGFLATLVFAGCKSNDAPTPTNVADQFASAFCAGAAHCCQAEGAVADPAACKQYAQTIVGTSQFEIRGASTFNADIAAACIKAARAFDCWDRSEIEALCRFIYTGVVPIGGGCLSDEDCAQSPTRAACGVGGTCVADSVLGQAGAPCLGRTIDCALPDGLLCVTDPQNAAVESCQPRSDVGGPCSYLPDCRDGLRCDKTIPGKGTCAPVRPAGAPCADLDCDWDAQCLNGVCTPWFLSEAVCVAPPGSSDAGAVDAGGCSNGKVWCSCSNTYVACGPDGSADVCGCVIVGGDAGSALPDPGVIFVQVWQTDLVADPTRNVFYVSSLNEGVRALSSETGATLWVASNGLIRPAKLAVSDDGSTLYAADGSLGWIERVDLAKGAPDLTIMLPPDPGNGGTQLVTALAVVPGSPRTVIAVTSGAQTLVQALDDGVPRTASVQVDAYSLIQLDGPSTIYVLGRTGALTTLTLTASGVQNGPSGPVPGLFTADRRQFLFDGELAFADDGHVVDPRRGVLLGTYSGAGLVAVDRVGGRSYAAVAASTSSSGYRLAIGEFDRTAFTRLRTLSLSFQDMPATNLVRTPDGTLAVAEDISATAVYGVALVRPDAWQAATTP